MMSSKKGILLLLLLLLIGGSACSDKSVSGDVTETGNAFVIGEIIGIDGEPYKTGNLKFYQSSENMMTLTEFDTAQSNERGEFSVLMAAGQYSLEIINKEENSGFLSPMFFVDSSGTIDLEKIRLNELAKYNGVVVNFSAQTGRIILKGTPYSAPITSGQFSFSKIPAQKYQVYLGFYEEDDTQENFHYLKTIDLRNGSVTDELFDFSSEEVLIDDFSDDNNESILGAETEEYDDGWWFVETDVDDGGNSELYTPYESGPKAFEQAIVDDGSGNLALHGKYTIGNNTITGNMAHKFPHVSVGVNIGGNQEMFSLEDLDSLTLQAKGNGEILVEFSQYLHLGDIHITAYKKFDLRSSWNRLKINPKDLTVDVLWFPHTITDEYKQIFEDAGLPIYSKKPTTWKEMGGVVTAIKVVAVSGTEFWIDDLKIYGVDRETLINK